MLMKYLLYGIFHYKQGISIYAGYWYATSYTVAHIDSFCTNKRCQIIVAMRSKKERCFVNLKQGFQFVSYSKPNLDLWKTSQLGFMKTLRDFQNVKGSSNKLKVFARLGIEAVLLRFESTTLSTDLFPTHTLQWLSV